MENKKMYDVITFGSAIVDFFLQSTEFKLIKSKSLICQSYEDKIDVDKREIYLGGGGTNTAVSFARKGFKTACVIRFGQDFLGNFIKNQLKREQVNLDFANQIDQTTDSSVVLNGPDGGRTILVYRGPTKLEQKNIDFPNLDSKWFYLASLEGNMDLIKKLLAHAQENEINVFWNPGKRELRQKKELIPLVSQVKIFMVNRQEAKMVSGKDISQKGFWPEMKKLGAEMAIVTDGEKGASIQYSQGTYYSEAPKLDVVDQTGAGDAFGSGFLAGLLKGQGMKSAFKSAMDNAGSVVQNVGAQTGLLRK